MWQSDAFNASAQFFHLHKGMLYYVSRTISFTDPVCQITLSKRRKKNSIIKKLYFSIFFSLVSLHTSSWNPILASSVTRLHFEKNLCRGQIARSPLSSIKLSHQNNKRWRKKEKNNNNKNQSDDMLYTTYMFVRKSLKKKAFFP